MTPKACSAGGWRGAANQKLVLLDEEELETEEVLVTLAGPRSVWS